MHATRFDSFKLDSVRRIPTGQGDSYFLEVTGTLAVPGVMEYREGGRTVREYVPPQVLADKDWLDAMDGAPITIEHPPALLGPSNVQAYQAGSLKRPTWSSKEQAAKGVLRVTGARAIQGIESKRLLWLSPGYKADIDDTPGTTPDGEKYDRRQVRRVVGNHLALTESPRGGAACRMDSKETAMPAVDRGQELATKLMKHLGAREDAMDDPVESAHRMLDDHMAKAAEGQGAPDDKMDGLHAKLDALHAKLDAMGQQHPEPDADDAGGPPDGDADDAGRMDDDDEEEEAPEPMEPEERQDSSLWLKVARAAEKLGISDDELKGKKASAVRDLCLARMDSGLDLGKKSEAYKAARFDAEYSRIGGRRISGLQAVIDNAQPVGTAQSETPTGGFGSRLVNLK